MQYIYLMFSVLFFFPFYWSTFIFPCHFPLPLWDCAEKVLKRNTFFGVLECFVKTSILAGFTLTLLFNACLPSLPLATNCFTGCHIALYYCFAPSLYTHFFPVTVFLILWLPAFYISFWSFTFHSKAVLNLSAHLSALPAVWSSSVYRQRGLFSFPACLGLCWPMI